MSQCAEGKDFYILFKPFLLPALHVLTMYIISCILSQDLFLPSLLNKYQFTSY